MFGPHSKPISAFFDRFDCDTTQFGRYDLILAESPDLAWIEAELVRIEPSHCESERKKKKEKNTTQTQHRRIGQPRWWPHPASGRIRLRCGTLPAALVLPSFFFSFVYCFLSYKLVFDKDYACHDLKTTEDLRCCCWRCDHIGRPYKICGIHSAICRVRVVHGSSCKTWRISMDVLEKCGWQSVLSWFIQCLLFGSWSISVIQNLMAPWRIRLVPQFGSHSPPYSLLTLSTNVYNPLLLLLL